MQDVEDLYRPTLLDSLFLEIPVLLKSNVCCVSVCVEGSVDVQYSRWQSGFPHENTRSCVIVTQHNEWNTWDCNDRQRYVCQSQWQLIT